MAEDGEERDEDGEDSGSHAAATDRGGEEEAGPEAAKAAEDADAADAAPKAAEDAGARAERKREADPPGRSSRLWWLLPIAVVIEFWAYGRNGYVEVCVGKTGETDFALVGAERTDDNRWKFPRCETRLNLGLRSEYDARVTEATKVACRGATLFKHRGETTQCEGEQDGWEHRVDGRFCPPWDPNYYEHLFWFLK